MAWETVCTPKWAGGLGVPNLRWMNIAMQAKWPWLQRPDRSRPWSEFKIKVPSEAMQIFQAATRCRASNGMNTLFWEDRWLDGMRIQELAPAVYDMVPRRFRQACTLGQVGIHGSWAACLGPNVSMVALQQFLWLWQRVQAWEPVENVSDRLVWSWETMG